MNIPIEHFDIRGEIDFIEKNRVFTIIQIINLGNCIVIITKRWL